MAVFPDRISPPPIKLIQVTDCHLLADPTALLKHVSPDRTLSRICTAIRRYHTDATAILLTGDLSQDGSGESYRRLVDFFSALPVKKYALAGNHDSPEVMQQYCPPCIALDKSVPIDCWRILLLHSVVESTVGGKLKPPELDWLRKQLSEFPEQYFLIALHHPPVPTGSEWLDKISLQNPKELEALLTSRQQVKLLLHGHSHQASCYLWRHIPCYGTPSSWRQFTANTASHRMDFMPPGYRVVELQSDGSHRSWIEFVQ